MRAAIYTRVSKPTKSWHGDVHSFDQRPEVQEQPLRRLAEYRGWTITRVYTDRVSGSKESRPGLDELLADASRSRFDVLMVWRFDRLSRSAVHFLQTVERLRSLGVDFVSHEQALDTTTAMGKFTLTMFAALAELERSVIRERIQAGIDYARSHGTKSGKPLGRPLALFRRDQVAELRRDGHSWAQIAKTLHTSASTVRRVLTTADRSPNGSQPLPKSPGAI